MTDNNQNPTPDNQPEETKEGSKPAAKTSSKTSSTNTKGAAESQPPVKPSTPLPADAAQPPKPAKGRAGVVIGSLALLVAVGLGGWLYYHAHQQADELIAQRQALDTRLSGELDQQRQQLADASASLEQLRQTAQQASQSAQLSAEQLTSLQKKVADIDSKRPNDWMLAEADYLVRMAGRKLWLEHDLGSSVALLQAADQRLSELNDPSLVNVRQAFADDISELKGIRQVDRDGIVLTLSGASRQIDKLPLAGVDLPEVSEQMDTELSSNLQDWKENLYKTWNQFAENFITVRRREGEVTALISPKQAWYLQENLRTQLLQAQLAVYREQPELYQQALNNAIDWIRTYYDTEQPATQGMLDQLGELASLQINRKLPQALSSQAALEKVLQQRISYLISPVN